MVSYDSAVGRYVHLPFDGETYRVYFEEAGAGPAILCQHTAGSDGRQWRHLLEDREITSRFRVIAYDLPQHGKSLPALGSDWWSDRLSLSTDWFTRFVVAFAAALELDQPIYLGCSMGGHLSVDLALRFPDVFSAVIGVEGSAATIGTLESVVHMDHPRVPNQFKAEVMYSLTAPQSAEADRREATWGYLTGAPRVHRGDLDFYLFDHDVRETAHLIDTSLCAVYLMSGEYDWSATPEDTRQLAELIPGATLTTMAGVGHFPMVENYAVFRSHLLPILDERLP